MNQSARRQLDYQDADRALPSLETWNLTPPVLIGRTRFFSLTPVGTGTPLVESLASYTSALAAEHGVNVGNFINGELIPLVHSDPQSRSTSVRPFQGTRSFTVGRLPTRHVSGGSAQVQENEARARFVGNAGCKGMLPPSATLCCHWRHSRCTVILPPGAIQSCHLFRSGLDCHIQWSAAAWPLRPK